MFSSAKKSYHFLVLPSNLSPASDAFRLDNKIALVTGGASGIGAATCRELTRAGAQVLIADLNLAAAHTLAAELPGAKAVEMDVTSASSIAAAFATIPQLDILVNNAGIGLVGDITRTSEDDFARVMRVNVNSVFLVTQAAFPLLLASRGSIVNIGSVAGSVGVKQRLAYCTSKGAVHAMTRQIAVDYPKELRINCIAPGTVQTPFVEGYLDKYHAHEKEKVRAELVARQPIGRLGTPEDIASLVRYLCSHEAEFINGAIIPIDGGWTAA
jgi:2-keto-3-deoxy-L-fuconate dehydrogenase